MAKTTDVGLKKRLEVEGRRIASQHVRLRELWRQFLAPAELDLSQFEPLRAGLFAHFEIEERVQIPALHGSAPENELELAQIVEDHSKFRAHLEKIQQTIENRDLQLVRVFAEDLHRQILDHESREEVLFTR